MRVRVATSVRRRLNKEGRYYLREAGEAVATRINNDVLNAIASLATHYHGHKFDNQLPNCYRINVKPLVIFYYRNDAQGYVLVYSLRGGPQRPMEPRIHKGLISRAERNSTEF